MTCLAVCLPAQARSSSPLLSRRSVFSTIVFLFLIQLDPATDGRTDGHGETCLFTRAGRGVQLTKEAVANGNEACVTRPGLLWRAATRRRVARSGHAGQIVPLLCPSCSSSSSRSSFPERRHRPHTWVKVGRGKQLDPKQAHLDGTDFGKKSPF